MNVFVGNLPFEAREPDVRKLFEGFGSVVSVTILMNKKNTKNRGFGFVEMADEEQAMAAIAGLNKNEFMGRPLDVMVARPRVKAEPEAKEAQIRPKERFERKPFRKDEEFRRDFPKRPMRERPSRIKGGRRSLSYLRRTERKPEELQKESVSWRRPEGESRPWRKPAGESKPWRKSESESRPWRRSEGESRSWKRPEGESRPWQRDERGSSPWQKSEKRTKPWERRERKEGFPKPWRKEKEGAASQEHPKAKTWARSESGGSKPWKKAGEKPWNKSKERPRRSGFRNKKSSGGYKR